MRRILFAACMAWPMAWATPSWCGGPPGRPRVFVTPAELPALRSRAQDTHKSALGYVPAEAWRDIKARADHFLAAGPYHYAVDLPGREGGPAKRWEYTLSKKPPPRHDDYSHYPPWTAMFQERGDSITTRLRYLSLAWLVTQDARYFDRAREIVLSLCAWPGVWTDPSYGGGRPCLDTGHAATWVGIFYDWCHDRLTPKDRKTIRTALAEKALAPIDKMIDSVPAYHNFTAVVATGLCVGAIALRGEDDRADAWVRHAVARAKLYFDSQGGDGGAMEGPMYGTYAADTLADMIWALATAEVPNELLAHHYIRTLPRYCISLLNPGDDRQPCFGDGGPTAGFGRMMSVLALGGEAQAAWYCARIGALKPDTPRGFLAFDAARLRPEQPADNPSDCFVDVGYAVLRDGYKPGAGFLAMKCGPPSRQIGHNHFDHNSFVLNYAGRWLACDPGYRSYFDPPRRRYTVSTLGHNSIVLDLDAGYLARQDVSVPGHDQVSLAGGRLREFFTSERFDYVLGDAAAVYNTKAKRVLDRFDRQIVFAKPNVFFIRDTLAAPAEHAYSFLLHAGPGTVAIAGQHAEIRHSQYLLEAHVFSPAGVRPEGPLGMTAASYPGAESYGPYLAATTGKTKAAAITTVLVPRRGAEIVVNGGFEQGMTGWQPRDMPGFKENHVIDRQVRHGGGASARIDNGGYYYSSRFSLPPGTKITARWWARCTAAAGASSILYYWKDGESFARKSGPAVPARRDDQWRAYEVSDTIPPGTQEVCLALQFFGKGQCWYDDVEIAADPAPADSVAAKVAPLEGGAAGAVCSVGPVTHVLLCGPAGRERTLEAAGHRIWTDAELAVVSFTRGQAAAMLVRGTAVRVDGKAVAPAQGTWRVNLPAGRQGRNDPGAPGSRPGARGSPPR